MSPAEHQNPSIGQRTGPSTARSKSTKGEVERKRASRACNNCRNRKIKCDVQEKGAVCSICHSNGILCIVSRDNRGKKKQLVKAQPSGKIDEQEWASWARITQAADILIPWPEASDESENSGEEYIDVSRLDAALAHKWPTLINSVSYRGDLTVSARDVPDVNPHGFSSEIPLPSYIKPRYDMKSDDLQYLWDKGAFRIPDTLLRNALLQSYIEYVHPSLPLINLHKFLAIACAGKIGEYAGKEQRISLLLFQAILFAGSAFVDEMALQMAGYSTRKEARAAFYQKVKLLYDFDYEVDDKLALVQSLLLMTYWHEVSSDGKDDWHWLGVAISITTSLHHRDAIVNLDARDQKVWNRVWWCCFTRDRLLALGLRRTPRIEEDDCHSFTTPKLTLDDFEIRKLDACNLTISLSECRVVQDTSLQLKLADTFIAKTELCISIGHVLKTQYSPQVRDHGIESDPNGKLRSRIVLLPKLNADGFEACEDELARWLQRLQPGMLPTTLTAERVAANGNSLIIEQAVLHMIYLATCSTLHRPRALSAAPAVSFQQHIGLQTISRRIIREASTEITRINIELYKLNLTRYLPTTAVTVLLPAIISHIQSIKSASNQVQVRSEATEGLVQCMQILQKLRNKYQPADEATHFLEDALRLADIQIITEPMPTLGNGPTPVGGIRNGEMKFEDVSDELSLFVNPPQYLEFPHVTHSVSSASDATLWYHASALKTIGTTNNDFQALDPAVSFLSEELAWLDNASTMIPHLEPAIDCEENLNFPQNLLGDEISMNMDFGTAVCDEMYGSAEIS